MHEVMEARAAHEEGVHVELVRKAWRAAGKLHERADDHLWIL
jgi:hypothetical protein